MDLNNMQVRLNL